MIRTSPTCRGCASTSTAKTTAACASWSTSSTATANPEEKTKTPLRKEGRKAGKNEERGRVDVRPRVFSWIPVFLFSLLLFCLPCCSSGGEAEAGPGRGGG